MEIITLRESVQIRSFFCFLVFHLSPNTRKHGPEKNSYVKNFHFVQPKQVSKVLLLCELKDLLTGTKLENHYVCHSFARSAFLSSAKKLPIHSLLFLFLRITSFIFICLPLREAIAILYYLVSFKESFL